MAQGEWVMIPFYTGNNAPRLPIEYNTYWICSFCVRELNRFRDAGFEERRKAAKGEKIK